MSNPKSKAKFSSSNRSELETRTIIRYYQKKNELRVARKGKLAIKYIPYISAALFLLNIKLGGAATKVAPVNDKAKSVLIYIAEFIFYLFYYSIVGIGKVVGHILFISIPKFLYRKFWMAPPIALLLSVQGILMTWYYGWSFEGTLEDILLIGNSNILGLWKWMGIVFGIPLFFIGISKPEGAIKATIGLIHYALIGALTIKLISYMVYAYVWLFMT